MAEDQETEQALKKAGAAWRQTSPTMASPYDEFKRRALAAPPRVHLSTLVSAALVMVVGTTVAGVLIEQGAVSPRISGLIAVPSIQVSSSAVPLTSASPPRSPSVSAAPTPSVSGTAGPNDSSSPTLSPKPAQWIQIATASGVRPLWSPDGQHVLLAEEFANEARVLVLMSSDGQQIASYPGYADPAWIGADVFVAFEASKEPADPTIEVSVPVIIGDAADGSTTQTSAPCCDPIGNGAGAITATWLPPTLADQILRPQFDVWSSGVPSARQDGYPLGWSPAGDKLIVQRPFTTSEVIDGWIEVLDWPALSPLFESDHARGVDDATFDPSGHYVAYTGVNGQGDGSLGIDIVDLASASVARVPLHGDPAVVLGSGFAWNAQSNLLVSDPVAGTLATYGPDGKQLESHPFAQPSAHMIVIESSRDGGTLVLTTSSTQFVEPEQISVERNGVQSALPTIGTSSLNHYLSPKGTGLIVTDDGGRAWLAVFP